MSSALQEALKLIRRHVNYGKEQPFSRFSSFRYLCLIGSLTGYFVEGKAFLPGWDMSVGYFPLGASECAVNAGAVSGL